MKGSLAFLSFVSLLVSNVSSTPVRRAQVPRAATCDTEAIALVKSQVAHSAYFCTFYTAAPRVRSPLPGMDATALTSACQCITAALSTQIILDHITSPYSFEACGTSDLALIRDEYTSADAFCSFYTAVPRHLSPIPGHSVRSLKRACGCLSFMGASSSGTSSTASSSSSSTGSSSTDNTSITLPTDTSSVSSSTDASATETVEVDPVTASVTETIDASATDTSATGTSATDTDSTGTSASATDGSETGTSPTGASSTETVDVGPINIDTSVTGATVIGATVTGATDAEPTVAEPTVIGATIVEPTVTGATVVEPTVFEPTATDPTTITPATTIVIPAETTSSTETGTTSTDDSDLKYCDLLEPQRPNPHRAGNHPKKGHGNNRNGKGIVTIAKRSSLLCRARSTSTTSTSTSTSSSTTSTSLSTTPVRFCSAQASLLSSVDIIQASEASLLCSSLLRSTVSAISTSYSASTFSVPTTVDTQTIPTTNTVIEYSTETATVSTDQQLTTSYYIVDATQTDFSTTFTNTQNKGTVSTVFVTVTVTADTVIRSNVPKKRSDLNDIIGDQEQAVPTPADSVIITSTVDDVVLPTPTIWASYNLSDIMSACGCIIQSEVLEPTTIYTATENIETAVTTTFSVTATSTDVTTITTTLPTSISVTFTTTLTVSSPSVTSLVATVVSLVSDISTVSLDQTTIVTTTTSTTTSSTSTSATFLPIPTLCSNLGIKWADYTNSAPKSGPSYANFDPTAFKKAKTLQQATTQNENGLSSTFISKSIYIYGSSSPIPRDNFALNQKGYLFARTSGTYIFTLSNLDGIALLWLGDNAISGWTRTNANALAVAPSMPTSKATIKLTAGTYVPFRTVFGHDSGQASFALSITAPDGSVIVGATRTTSLAIVQFPCDGSLAKPFPAFENE